MIAQLERQLYTPEDYSAAEAESEIRHEYINGEIVPMARAMPNHNRITRNLCSFAQFGAQAVDID